MSESTPVDAQTWRITVYEALGSMRNIYFWSPLFQCGCIEELVTCQWHSEQSMTLCSLFIGSKKVTDVVMSNNQVIDAVQSDDAFVDNFAMPVMQSFNMRIDDQCNEIRINLWSLDPETGEEELLAKCGIWLNDLRRKFPFDKYFVLFLSNNDRGGYVRLGFRPHDPYFPGEGGDDIEQIGKENIESASCIENVSIPDEATDPQEFFTGTPPPGTPQVEIPAIPIVGWHPVSAPLTQSQLQNGPRGSSETEVGIVTGIPPPWNTRNYLDSDDSSSSGSHREEDGPRSGAGAGPVPQGSCDLPSEQDIQIWNPRSIVNGVHTSGRGRISEECNEAAHASDHLDDNKLTEHRNSQTEGSRNCIPQQPESRRRSGNGPLFGLLAGVAATAVGGAVTLALRVLLNSDEDGKPQASNAVNFHFGIDSGDDSDSD